MTSWCKHLVLALVVSSATGCGSSLVVQSDASPAAAATDKRQIALLAPQVGDAELANEVVRPILREALESRGFVVVERDAAELIASYKVVTATTGGDGPGNADELTHRKSVFVIIQDAASLDIVWLGWSQDEVQDSELPERTAEAARRIVASIPG